MQTLLITGAAGNLGGILAKHLKNSGLNLHLMIHNRNVPDEIQSAHGVKVFRADLGRKDSLKEALTNVDTIIHFAGILFHHHPERFLPVTNTVYFANLLEMAVECGVKRVILVSFPHVEGETDPGHPAKGILSGNPDSVHARTRLEEEKLLFETHLSSKTERVSLRVGMVYGKGILMIEGARWFARHRLLGIWKKPTWIHLISKADFLEAVSRAIIEPGIEGIYHLGDDGIQTLQEFLDNATAFWGYRKPWRMPVGMIFFAARIFEWWSWLSGSKSPLTRDFIKIGMVSYYGDTGRMRKELLRVLKYRTYRDGMETL